MRGYLSIDGFRTFECDITSHEFNASSAGELKLPANVKARTSTCKIPASKGLDLFFEIR